MRRTLIIFVSLGLNVVLAAILISARHPTPATSTGLQAAGTNKNHTEVVVRKQFFSWRQVESVDYPAYIANLKDIGCPEQTVRDIIIADVDQLYAKKRMEEVPTADQQWWRSEPDTNFTQAAKIKLDALDQERRGLLTSLLGTNWDTTYPSTTKPVVALTGPVLGELSPETKEAVQQIAARSQQRVQAYLEAQKQTGKPVDPAELARMHKQSRTELAQVLNQPQLEEFLLRYSQTASNLRKQMRGFDATQDEFRALFRLRDPLELQLESVTGDAPAIAAQRATLQQQLDDAIKNALPDARYQEYRLSQDPAYRAAVTEGAGAPPETVQRLYELNKVVQQEQDRIRNDPTLSPEEKQQQLAALAQQQQIVGDQILGVAPPTPPPTPPPLPPQIQLHAYSPGETVDMIAARYGVSANSILTANPDVNFNQIRSGQPIRVPKPSQ